MDLKISLQKNREKILQITNRYGALNIRIFGSAARGDAGPDSDVDFLVSFSPGFTLLRHAALIRELETLLQRKVDVVSERELRPRIKDRVLREAIPL